MRIVIVTQWILCYSIFIPDNEDIQIILSVIILRSEKVPDALCKEYLR